MFLKPLKRQLQAVVLGLYYEHDSYQEKAFR